MAFDPKTRIYPVSVVTIGLPVPHRDDPLPLEVWFPADETHRGDDLDAATQDRFRVIPAFADRSQLAVRDAAPRNGDWPLLVFSHGYGGQRRQSTFLCTHLASRGWVVVAPDHLGNTTLDLMSVALAERRGRAISIPEIAELALAREHDIRAILDSVSSRAAPIPARIDASRVGTLGHSLGGWVAMKLGDDAAVSACAALGAANLEALQLESGGDAAKLFLAAEKDSIVAVEDALAFAAAADGGRYAAVLSGADHFHFCDDTERAHESMRRMPQITRRMPWMGELPPYAQLAPAAPIQEVAKGLVAAFFEATLGDCADAKQWLSSVAPSLCRLQTLGPDQPRGRSAHAAAASTPKSPKRGT